MKQVWFTALLAAGCSCALPTLAADKPVRIGYITTLSTPAGYLGEDSRDGFRLAIAQGGGKLGGVPVELMVSDDELQPGTAKQTVDRLLLDGVTIYSGPMFSNVVAAVAPAVVRKGIFISGNAGPSGFAGKGCMANYFASATQNNTSHEIAGMVANQLGYRKMVILAANYQGGKDALEGFKSTFKGQVTEIYTKLNQIDYSVEIGQIRAAAPDAIYQFHTGGSGISFLKQYGASGLNGKIPMILTSYAMDERMLDAVGQLAVGTKLVSMWSPSLDNPANRKFVQAFAAAYKRQPTLYAAEGYDTALMLGAALQKVHGDAGNVGALRAALRDVKFDSVRGNFAFGNNQHPVQDWYLMQVVDGSDGKPATKVIDKVASAQGDTFASECALK